MRSIRRSAILIVGCALHALHQVTEDDGLDGYP